MVKIECLNCGNNVYIAPYLTDVRKFCCRKCVSEYKIVIKKCIFCEKEFKVSRLSYERAKFCSKNCRELYHRERGKEIICKNCGIKKYVNFYRKDAAKFCSKNCQNEYYNNDIYVKCSVCYKEFIRKKWQIKKMYNVYCSILCYKKRSPKIIVKCLCGKEFFIHQSRKKYYNYYYCSNECRFKYGIIGKLTECTNFNKQYQKFVRSARHTKRYYNWRRECLERDKFKCCICKREKKVTVHHKVKTMFDFIKEYGFDKEDIYNDEMFFNVKNGISLCRRCHFNKHVYFKMENCNENETNCKN